MLPTSVSVYLHDATHLRRLLPTCFRELVAARLGHRLPGFGSEPVTCSQRRAAWRVVLTLLGVLF